MWQKITDLPLMAYIALTGFIKNFGKDERGLSGVVVAVLLILVAVLAVVAIWVFLGDWLAGLWDRITAADSGIA